MGTLVNANRVAHTPSLTVCSMVFNIPAFKVMKIWRATAIGGAVAAAALERMGLYPVATVGSGGSPTTITMNPERTTDSVPSGFTCVFGYTTEPTISAPPLAVLEFQPFGGFAEWNAEGSPIIVANESASAIQVALRSVSGTSAVALRVRAELGL